MKSNELDVMLNEIKEIETAKKNIANRERLVQKLPIAIIPEVLPIIEHVVKSKALPAYESRLAYVFSALVLFSPFTLYGRKPKRGLRNNLAASLRISKSYASHEIQRTSVLVRSNKRLRCILNDVILHLFREIEARNANEL